MRVSWLSVSASLPGQRVFLAIAFRVRILLTSATFRLYSGADKEAPMATEVFLHKTTSRGVKKKIIAFLLCVSCLIFIRPVLHCRIFTGAR